MTLVPCSAQWERDGQDIRKEDRSIGMRALFRMLLVLSLGIPFLGAESNADEMKARGQLRRAVVHNVEHREFRTLENWATKFRTQESRTPSGVWELTQFYVGITEAFGHRKQTEAFWNRAYETSRLWRDAYPDSSTAHLAHAQLLVSHGWSFRGTGWARTVPEEAWEPFHEHLEEARRYLDETRGYSSADPYWYGLMMVIATAQQWPTAEFETLMIEGLANFPRYYESYFAAMRYYSPRWGGSPHQVETFADMAARRIGSKEGEALYARIYWAASQSHFDNRLFTDSHVDWPRMSKGIDDVLAKYPDEWNVNNFAKFACLAGDKKKTKTLIETKSRVDLQAWGTREFFDACHDWVYGIGAFKDPSP